MAEAMDVAGTTMSRNMPTTLLPGKLAGDREISVGYITNMRVSMPFYVEGRAETFESQHGFVYGE